MRLAATVTRRVARPERLDGIVATALDAAERRSAGSEATPIVALPASSMLTVGSLRGGGELEADRRRNEKFSDSDSS